MVIKTLSHHQIKTSVSFLSGLDRDWEDLTKKPLKILSGFFLKIQITINLDLVYLLPLDQFQHHIQFPNACRRNLEYQYRI